MRALAKSWFCGGLAAVLLAACGGADARFNTIADEGGVDAAADRTGGDATAPGDDGALIDSAAGDVRSADGAPADVAASDGGDAGTTTDGPVADGSTFLEAASPEASTGVDGGPCGAPGQDCCPGNPNGGGRDTDFCTGNGLVCNAGSGACEACGGPGQVCCAGGTCAAGGCCDSTADSCVASGAACSAGEGTCSGGGCQSGACGEIGQACCAGGVGCTSGFSTCDGAGRCAGCGGLGEACCPGDHGGQLCSEPFACDKSSQRCALCGGAGQSCCPGAICANGLVCGSNANVCN